MKKIFKCTFFSFALLCLMLSLDVNAKENDNSYYYDKVYNTGLDNGFSKKNKIVKGDPHFGWKLGAFEIKGFTSKTKDANGNIVFLTDNNDDGIELSFRLDQNINKLDGNKNLSISMDENGYDNEFGIKQTNFKKGTLIIRKTDPSGKTRKPEVYHNYLHGVKVGSNTKVKVIEEGDYELTLDYEIKEKGFAFFNSYTNYKITFKFSVRDGNCMVFPFDVVTKDELGNSSFTKNGFYLDFANSQYLKVSVKKEIYKKGAEGLVEDIRFNKVVKSGEEFREEGIYTFTIKNEYTDSETIKKIYVGEDNILKAYVQTGYSIDKIEKMVNLGATIDESGNITEVKESNENSIFDYLVIIIPILIALLFLGYKIIKLNIDDKKIDKKIIERENEKKDFIASSNKNNLNKKRRNHEK